MGTLESAISRYIRPIDGLISFCSVCVCRICLFLGVRGSQCTPFCCNAAYFALVIGCRHMGDFLLGYPAWALLSFRDFHILWRDWLNGFTSFWFSYLSMTYHIETLYQPSILHPYKYSCITRITFQLSPESLAGISWHYSQFEQISIFWRYKQADSGSTDQNSSPNSSWCSRTGLCKAQNIEKKRGASFATAMIPVYQLTWESIAHRWDMRKLWFAGCLGCAQVWWRSRSGHSWLNLLLFRR